MNDTTHARKHGARCRSTIIQNFALTWLAS